MSLSNPALTNPAHRFLEWKGGKGDLQWYEKETKQNHVVKLPYTFIVLDELATITGFSDNDQSSFYSNEVRNVTKDEFNVKIKGMTREVGLYANLTQTRSKGAKYAKSVYIAYKEGTEWQIGNIKFSGASLTAWIEFSQANKVQEGKVALTGSEEGKKGATVFQIPTFEWSSFEGDEFNKAVALDRELQVYLSHYLTAPAETNDWPSDQAIDDELGKATPEQVADFERRKAEKLADKREDDEAIHKYQSIGETFDDGEPLPDFPGEM